MEISLQCGCGQKFVATEGMAGALIPCQCGKSLRVPSLTEMRRQSADMESCESRSVAITSQQQLRQVSAALLYGCILAGTGLVGLPLLLVSSTYGGPMAGTGALVILVGHAWFITQIFTGNPTAALVVLLVPVVGELLAYKFVFDHWRIARWPILCQGVGTLLLLFGLAPV